MKKIIVHAGTFHADDVMCVALANKFLGINTYERVLNVSEEDMNDEDILICDIGRKYDGIHLFDHHQDSAPERNGYKYSSCGQLLEYLSKDMSKNLYENLKRIISGIDINDNYGKNDSFSVLISSFNPTWDSGKLEDECFNDAVNIALTYIENCITKAESVNKAKDKIKQYTKSSFGNILIMDEYLPFMDYVVGTKYDFVIYPSNRGGWNAQCVPISKKQMNMPKKPFFAGLIDLEGVTFVHAARFLLAAETKEVAIEACRRARGW